MKHSKKVALRAKAKWARSALTSQPAAAMAPSWTGQLWAWFWPASSKDGGRLGWWSWKGWRQ